MTDLRVEKLADVLVNYSVKVKPGDWVFVNSNPIAQPLVSAVARRVLEAGGNPTPISVPEDMREMLLRTGSDEQLEWISPIERLAMEQADVMINIQASSNTRGLTAVDPQRQRLFQVARRELLQTYRQRAAEGSLRWVITQYPCPAYAQDADMSLSDYEDFVYGTTFADQPDPIRCWLDMHERQQQLIEWLAGKKEVVVRGPHVDLKLSIDGRGFINSSGTKNMPSGEIYTSPVEESAEGWIRFDYPAIRDGREVEGVEFTFEAGKVMKATARKNEDYLLRQLDSDEGARYLGEFAIGTNFGIKQFTKSILYDEKIGGTMHLAVGAGFAEAGGKNTSTIHWDFICDMRHDSEILVDGDLFYKNGEFKI